ncbi:hypothetical protein RRG08_041174 [Elysia crispata]|uniref:Uncharacterized protein n=1 Tax=Elysia crispata TaxID=231223 RepID=A0AAE0XZ99_9GAST|nr:hypothetical protein RRG08_041174 [Elysia crispata]
MRNVFYTSASLAHSLPPLESARWQDKGKENSQVGPGCCPGAAPDILVLQQELAVFAYSRAHLFRSKISCRTGFWLQAASDAPLNETRS